MARRNIVLSVPDAATRQAAAAFDATLRGAIGLWGRLGERDRERAIREVQYTQNRAQVARDMGPDALADFDERTRNYRKEFGIRDPAPPPTATTRQVPGEMVRSQVRIPPSESASMFPQPESMAVSSAGDMGSQTTRMPLPPARTADIFEPGPSRTETVPADYSGAQDPLYRMAAERERLRQEEARQKQEFRQAQITEMGGRAERAKAKAQVEAQRDRERRSDDFAKGFSDYGPDIQGLARAAHLSGRPFDTRMAEALSKTLYGPGGYVPPKEGRETARREQDRKADAILGIAKGVSPKAALDILGGKDISEIDLEKAGREWKQAMDLGDSKISRIKTMNIGVKDAIRAGDKASFLAQWKERSGILGIPSDDAAAEVAWNQAISQGLSGVEKDLDEHLIRAIRSQLSTSEQAIQRLRTSKAGKSQREITALDKIIEAEEIRHDRIATRLVDEINRARSQAGLPKRTDMPSMKMGKGGKAETKTKDPLKDRVKGLLDQ